MKVVVADTSPINYLVLIGEVDLLERLYGEILIPDVVAHELRDSESPQEVLRWTNHLPSWIQVRPTPASAEQFERLDAGERAAILLAEAQTSPVLLLVDDAAGRAEAGRRHIPATGNARRHPCRCNPRLCEFVRSSNSPKGDGLPWRGGSLRRVAG